MTKINICTINGGGSQTMLRLANSMVNTFGKLKEFEWNWTILVQGNCGADDKTIGTIKRYNRNINLLRYPRNLGTVWAWNELIDWSKMNFDFDYFLMIDDDMVITNPNIVKILLQPFLDDPTIATSADRVCYFGNATDLPELYNRVGDHGSGCTMYKREVFEKCGYHNECIIQYAHDTDFNNRIKMAFGEDCLRVTKNPLCSHHNQTGTKNCFPDSVWAKTVKRDSQFLEKVTYDKPYLARSFFKQPLWSLDFAVKI
jgi:glycosyltransferase involved in cell wall biosynthesis